MVEIKIENHFVESLPGDSVRENSRRQVTQACYSYVTPKKSVQPELIAFSKDLAEELGFDATFVGSSKFVDIFSGSSLIANSKPYAMCYGGHQFGQWAGQLGDGRAINLGEVFDKKGQRQSLQLKGAGPTPYSRTADGLAVLRSSLREFLCSEAMHYLGVPTTRALSLIGSGEKVLRDMFYDGRPEYEPGAVVCRVAPSFIRFGNFEILAARQEHELLKKLADYTIENYFPEFSSIATDKYLQWFACVSDLTLKMIVDWQRVGFVHGVMNTDNMSIHGLTIDYGPYGWLDNFDPNWTPNTTDAEGRRYRYANQPGIAQWNLLQLANALFPLIKDAQALQTVIEDFASKFSQQWLQMMSAKIGIQNFNKAKDEPLINKLNDLLQTTEVDMTLFYRRLANFSSAKVDDWFEHFKDCFYQAELINSNVINEFSGWFNQYSSRIQQYSWGDEERASAMNSVNPKFVLRNYLAQLAIDKATEKDYSLVNTLLELLKKPYDEQNGYEQYAVKRPDWARQRAGCSMLSCSS